MLDSINDDYTITAKRQKSTYKGVFRCGKKFKAQIQTNGVQNYLGLFDTEIEAAQAYDAHARVVLGSRAKTNFQYDTPASDDAAMPSEMYRSRSNKNTKRVYAGVKVRNTLEGGLVSSKQQYVPTPQLHYHCEVEAGESVNRKRSRPSDEHLYPEEVVYSGINHPETYAGDEYDEGEDPDWREQIYYWTGLLSFDRQHSQFQWNGSWVGSYTGKPESSEFLRSTNYFEYKSEVVADPSAVLSAGTSFVNADGVRCGCLRPQSGYFRGYYMMDNDGSGSLEKYLDKAFYVEFEELPSSGEAGPVEYEVVGKGDSDFGAFVLSGTFYSETGILEVARQYITDDDERATMDLPQLRRQLSAK